MLLTPHIVRTHGDHRRRSAADLHRIAAEPRRSAVRRRSSPRQPGRAARRRARAAGACRAGTPSTRGCRHRSADAGGPSCVAARRDADSGHDCRRRIRRRRHRSCGAAAGRAGARSGRRHRRTPTRRRPDAGSGTASRGAGSRRSADHVARHRSGAGHHLAAGHAVPRRRRAVHRADLGHQRSAAVDHHVDADFTTRRCSASGPCRRAASCARAAPTRRSPSRSAAGRVDITITRAADATGASGTGLLGGGAVRRHRAGHVHADR